MIPAFWTEIKILISRISAMRTFLKSPVMASYQCEITTLDLDPFMIINCLTRFLRKLIKT